MQNWTDFFSGDNAPFSLSALVAMINDVEHIPGRAGELVFAGRAEGVPTTTATFEIKAEKLSLIQTAPRGSSGDRNNEAPKRKIRAAVIPHIPTEEQILADQVVGVREFGSTDQLQMVTSAVNSRLETMARRLDTTLENHRLGALRGKILDADGTELTDLFKLFEVKNSQGEFAPEVFDLDLESFASSKIDFRVMCQDITRHITRRAKATLPKGAKPWVFVGDNLFDKLLSNKEFKEAYKNTADQERRLAGNYAFGVTEFGGIVWENYRGTDDGSKTSAGMVGVDPDEGVGFIADAPELYEEYYAPADYMETVGTIGLPRYAKAAPDLRFQKFVDLEAQINPLPVCLRPATLFRCI